MRCAGVVKADGYGLGARQVAAALVAEGCDTFFVAHLAEGVALRDALGPKPEIHVLNGLPPGSEAEARRPTLFPSSTAPDSWRRGSKAGQQAGRKLPAAIQVDSGMSRLGMAPAEVEAPGEPMLSPASMSVWCMSHLACADEPAQCGQ